MFSVKLSSFHLLKLLKKQDAFCCVVERVIEGC